VYNVILSIDIPAIRKCSFSSTIVVEGLDEERLLVLFKVGILLTGDKVGDGLGNTDGMALGRIDGLTVGLPLGAAVDGLFVGSKTATVGKSVGGSVPAFGVSLGVAEGRS